GRIALTGQRLDERGLAAPVRTQDGDVLAGGDRERQAIERAHVTAVDGDVAAVDKGRRRHAYRAPIAARSVSARNSVKVPARASGAGGEGNIRLKRGSWWLRTAKMAS